MGKFIIVFSFIFVLISQAMAKPQVAITVDDIDLNPNDTPLLSLDERNGKILRALKENGDLQTALFVCGMRVDNEQGKKHLAEWDRANHLIANHSYSHFYYPSVDFEKFSNDILRGEKVISASKDFQKLFRFPHLQLFC